jgi:hypothetical protein
MTRPISVLASSIVLMSLTTALPVLANDAVGNELTCVSPVNAKDTAQTLKQRFKGDAEISDIDGAEGETMKAVVLFAKTPDKALQVLFYDDAMTQVSAVMPAPEATLWTAAGLKIGASLAEVSAANGGPFKLSGFDWDYGGYVTDFEGGKLTTLEGGCGLSVRFDPPVDAQMAESLSGDIIVTSTDPELVKLAPTVSSVAVQWAAPQ